MDHFQYRNGCLYAEEVPLDDIAQRWGTPCYVYSRATLERHWHAFDQAFQNQPHLVCFAVKANSNLAVLNVLARLGSGFDIVSVGELERVLVAGGDPGKIVFSGVGKRRDEMYRALEVGIRCFNIESAPELERLDQVAGEMGLLAPISVRVNPDVDAGTHPYISTGLRENKFGLEVEQALAVYNRATKLKNIQITGIDCHIGSQLTTLSPFLDALDRVLALVSRLKRNGVKLKHLDLGGGLGIPYTNETPPLPSEYVSALQKRLGDSFMEICVEPGRAIAGNAGVLLSQVEYIKPTPHKDFAIIDAAMNDLLRPSLYQAIQEIIPVTQSDDGIPGCFDLVGPVCETGDFLGKERNLKLKAGELLAVRSCGAYGFTMSSNYNSRPRVAEVMVDGDQAHLVRERECIKDLYRGESILPRN